MEPVHYLASHHAVEEFVLLVFTDLGEYQLLCWFLNKNVKQSWTEERSKQYNRVHKESRKITHTVVL